LTKNPLVSCETRGLFRAGRTGCAGGCGFVGRNGRSESGGELVAGQARHDFRDFGVVDATAELLRAGADGKDGHITVGVAARGPGHVGVLGENALGRGGQSALGGVERFGALVATFHHVGVGLAQRFDFVAGGLQFRADAEVYFQILAHQVPGEGVALRAAQVFEARSVVVAAHRLCGEQTEVEVVTAVAEGEAARFVVGGDEDEGFFRVLLVELIGHADGFVGVHDFVHHGGSIVRVARPVDLAAFDHAEELGGIFLHEEVDGAAGDVGECQVAGFAVEGVGQRGAVAVVGLATLEVDHAVGFAPRVVELFFAVGDDETGIAGLGIEVGLAFFERSGLEEGAAGEEVEIGLDEVATDLGVHLAVLLVGVEAGGGGVVDAHAGGNAHRGAGFFGPHGDGGDGRDAVGEHAHGVVIRLATGGQCGAAGGRVGDAVAVALGVDERDVGEAREGEGFDAAAPFDGGEIGLGGVDLVHAHAVADEVKDVLRPFLGEGCGGKGQT